MKNTFRTITMLIAVLSVGGFFTTQTAMGGGGSQGVTAIATIDPSCSLAPGVFNFGTLDTNAHAAGSPEITVTMANSASSNQDSSVAVFGANWLSVATPADNIMLVGNTEFDQNNAASGGPYNTLTVNPEALIQVAPGDTDNTFWRVLAVLNGNEGTGFTGDIDQAITLDFACVALVVVP